MVLGIEENFSESVEAADIAPAVREYDRAPITRHGVQLRKGSSADANRGCEQRLAASVGVVNFFVFFLPYHR